MPYNIWNAAAYEITNILIDFNSRWELNQVVQMVRKHCFLDWVEWKTERTLQKVDVQIKAIQETLQEEHDKKYVTPIVIEHAPDGSKAQELLGGTLQIKAPWLDSASQD